VYDRQITEDQVLTFGVSGMLYRNGLIMYDHQTESLWSHILGQAIGGEFQGTQLTFIPALQTSWQNWKELHPDTLVVSPALFGSDGYASYYISSREGVVGRGAFGGGPEREDTIRSKEYVVGVRLAGEARAYPFSVLNKERVVNDRVGDIPVAVFFDKSTVSAAVFDRRLKGEDDIVLTFEATDSPRVARDADTQSEWDVLTGTAISGPLAGTQLEQVPVTYAFWFGWIDYHIESTVYGVDR
jgi:hypothetical protein